MNLKLNKDESEFYLDGISYAGHIANPDWGKLDPKKISATKDVEAPINYDRAKRLLGHINHLPKFIPNCSAEREPLR